MTLFGGRQDHTLTAVDTVLPQLRQAPLRQELLLEYQPLVDVRTGGEREANGFIESALHIPLSELPVRAGELPTELPLVLHCAGGHRSSIAASLLRRRGFQDVSDILGGYAAWALATESTEAVAGA